jgi:3-dehydroquinate dehydratase type I
MICVSLKPRDTRDALEQMRSVFGKADLVELRLDMMERWDLGRLIGEKRLPIVVTLRKKGEGGGFQGDDSERLAILKEAVKLGADFLDLEMRGAKKILSELKEEARTSGGRTRFIISSHNWTYTPQLPVLKRLVKKCFALGADIAKIVTNALRPQDNLATMQLVLWGEKDGIPTISFCMGKLGRPSRIMAPLLGAPFTYACIRKGMELAPGQLTLGEVRRALDILRGSHERRS